MAPPAALPDDPQTTLPGPSALPEDMRMLARHARSDAASARELATLLLARGHGAADAAAHAGLPQATVEALARVRHPGSAAGWVADDLVARRAR